MNQKVIGLIDCNSFFCSCERVFRPDLINRPVVVLSNNDGCAIARTPEAKALGIKMGEPYFKIKNLCKSSMVEVFSSNFALYTNFSDRVMTTLRKICPEVEVYSIDEAFVDLSGIDNLQKFGNQLKDTIFNNVGIPVGVGIAPTKVLAKLANRIAKNSVKSQGVVNLMDRKLQDVALARVEVEDIWGIGRASSAKLHALGIRTALDFRDYKNDDLIAKIFTKVGLQIKNELMGISCFPFNQVVDDKKEIMCSRTFGNTVFDKAVLKESVANYISNAASKLREQNSLCFEISLFARTNPFMEQSQHLILDRTKLVNPTCDTRKLIKAGFELIDKNFRAGYEYKKAGVKLSNFCSSNHYQLDFLSEGDSAKETELMRLIDRVNRREGEGTLKFAACGVSDRAWRMNRNHKSPRYLSSWSELKVFK